MGFQSIKVERRGPVLRIRMNRPDKLNAQNPTLIGEMDNRAVPAGRLEDEVDALADRIAALPAFAVRTVKKSINDPLDLMGQGRSWEHHFLLHVAGKRSEEFDQWWSAVEREGGGFKPGGLKETFRRRVDKQ